MQDESPEEPEKLLFTTSWPSNCRDRVQGRSHKFILGGYDFLLHHTTVLYTSSLTTSAAMSAQNNFQGLILGGYIHRYTPSRYAPGRVRSNNL